VDRNIFVNKGQIRIDANADYLEFLGFLTKDDGTTKLVWECNGEQRAWAQESTLQVYVGQPAGLRAKLNYTSDTASITLRVNCNASVKHIAQYHHAISNDPQNKEKIWG